MIVPEVGSFYVMDRGLLDLDRLFSLNNGGAFFEICLNNNILFKRRYSRPLDKSKGIQCDKIIRQTGLNTKKKCSKSLRRLKYHDDETCKTQNL